MKRELICERIIQCTPLLESKDAGVAAVDDADIKTCSICISDFDHGDIALLMPCSHPYHDACLIPWLRKQNTVSGVYDTHMPR